MMWKIIAAKNINRIGDALRKLPANNASDNDILKGILNLIYSVAGLVAVGFVVQAGYAFTRAEGNPAEIKKAQQTIVWAIVGLLVVVTAAVLTNFVIIKAEGWKG